MFVKKILKLTFYITDNQVGLITRKFTLKGVFTDADNFCIEFDPDLDVQVNFCFLLILVNLKTHVESPITS